MRKKESPQITPLMHISIILTIGILIAKMGYGYIDTIYWLVAALLSWGISFYLLKRSSATINAQCLSLIFCIFCMGGVLTSHQLDKKQDKPQIITEESLSSFDKTMLVTQECRNTIQKQLRSLNIQEQDFAIVSAMTLGDKTSLTKETKDIYSISGASHILAVSGLHIGIIFQLFILLLGGRRRSIPTIILSITAIWAYVIFIGMPASAIRSATMISICCFPIVKHCPSTTSRLPMLSCSFTIHSTYSTSVFKCHLWQFIRYYYSTCLLKAYAVPVIFIPDGPGVCSAFP